MDKIKTTFKVVIPDKDGLTLPLVFKQDAAHRVWVDWGDGTYPDTYSFQGLVEATHKYTTAGEYIITMYAVDDGYIVLGGGWTGGNAVGGNDEAAARMLVSASIGEDVVGISNYAFRGCENLEKLTFTDKQELTIGVFAFEGCCSLEEVVIPTNIATLAKGAFFNCSGLKKVVLPVGIYEIEDYAFCNCTQLRDISLLGPTRFGKYAFSGCRMLKEISFGEQCAFIEEAAFESCSCVRSLKLGTVKEIDNYAFYNAKSLSELTVPATVESIGNGAFGGCSSLMTIKMAAKEPPVLMGKIALPTNEGMKIIVPKGSGQAYREDTNWAIFADAIEEGK